jgi:hypothetical protein
MVHSVDMGINLFFCFLFLFLFFVQLVLMPVGSVDLLGDQAVIHEITGGLGDIVESVKKVKKSQNSHFACSGCRDWPLAALYSLLMSLGHVHSIHEVMGGRGGGIVYVLV